MQVDSEQGEESYVDQAEDSVMQVYSKQDKESYMVGLMGDILLD